MRITGLTIKNIGAIADISLAIDKPLILFYGEIKQGKTTILNAIRYAFGGAFPVDLLKHGELEGIVQLDSDEGRITREFYRSEDGKIKARPLTVIKEGKRLPKPVEWLKKFLNPFLLDGDYLANMTPDERKKYFVDIFHTSTQALDEEYNQCEAKARELRAIIKGYGALDVERVDRVNVEDLKLKLSLAKEQNAKEMAETNIYNATIESHNATVNARANEVEALDKEVARLQTNRAALAEWLKINPIRSDKAEPEITDTTPFEDAISNAAATNVRAEHYEANLSKIESRSGQERQVSALEQQQRDINTQKVERLAEATANCGVPGLVFLEGGAFKFEDTDAGMLSTSQIMKLSTHLSELYPEGVGLDLIDRAESLGKSVFEYVERAKAGNKTILATIVGERPAEVPADVGVFVVEKGSIS